MNHPSIDEIEKKTEYVFKDKELIKLAFTHSSYANESNKDGYNNNERLEFLGDAVLDSIISEYMYKEFPKMSEGELSKLRAAVVCETSLAFLARNIGLGNCLFLGRGEETSGGRKRDSILADVFEAVVGAITLDGGYDKARDYVLRLMKNHVNETLSSFKNIDSKTHLQEIIQKTSKTPVKYVIISENGPDHDKVFISKVIHEDKVLGEGSGKSKKEAEQSAAGEAIKKLKV